MNTADSHLLPFGHPHFLWLLLIGVPALAGFYYWAWQKKKELICQFVAARLLANLTVGVSAGRQKARMALVVIAVALLILVLARPQIGFTWEEARSRGLDIVVAIDTSRSMLATDVAPNRLRRAQLEALNLKRLARSDRLGIVAFAGNAFLQCPLTLDDEAFRQSVEALDVNIIPQGGTALAEAIEAARSAFKQGNDNHKVMVLFTDGEDHDGHAVEAAKEAAKEGLSIFTIGVGTANGELLRTIDVQGRTEFIKDADGNAVKSRLNEPLLQDIAHEAGGIYLNLRGADTMNLLYERRLAPLPKGDLATQRIKRPHERYQWLLGLAIALLLIETFIPERKPAAAAGRGRNDTASQAPLVRSAAVWVCLLLLPLQGMASTADALKQYEKGRFDRALSEYERSLQKNPDDARLQFNAGTAAFQNKDYDQALDHLNSALLGSDLPLQQKAYYNLGNTQFRLGEHATDPDKKRQLWEQAIRSYDGAVALDAKDPDAQFNRDWVKRKLEELKQQQQQQKQQQGQQKQGDKGEKGDKNEQKDPQQSQSAQDQQQQQQKQQDQSKSDAEKKQPQPSPEQQDQQKQQQEKSQQGEGRNQKQGEEQKGQPAPSEGQQGEPQDDGEGQPQGRAIRMTPRQAVQLLEALKGEEKVMTFRPTRTNRQDRVFKDW